MNTYTLQDIATAWEGDELTSQLQNIPLLESPGIESYIQNIPTQSTTHSSPTSDLFKEFFSLGEAAEPKSYPSPTIQPMTNPYPLTQQSPTAPDAITDWPSAFDIPNLDDFPDSNLIDGGQIPSNLLSPVDMTNNGQTSCGAQPVRPNAPIVDPSFLLYGSKAPNSSRHFTPLPQLRRNSFTGSDSSNPEDLALSPVEVQAEDIPMPKETLKADEGRLKLRPKPIIRGYGVDQDKPWIKTNSTKGKNTRAAKIADYRPEDHYTALSCAPSSWLNFNYTSFGELEAGNTYTAPQLNRYLFEHPLHYTPSGFDTKQSGLQLRIQKNPADSARRYPTYTSSRCRFAECYGRNHCINQGQYRVAFDEQTHRNANTDPQHNAGYVHLYCLERLLDFPLICANLNVRVEKRSLPNEPDARNRMRLGKSAALEDIANNFITSCETGVVPPDYPRRNQWRHEGTLTHKLCLAKVDEDGPTRWRAIQERGEKGSIYTQHLGNLEVEAVERDKTRKHKNQTTQKKGKRKQMHQDSEDESDEEAYKPRPSKRRARGRR